MRRRRSEVGRGSNRWGGRALALGLAMLLALAGVACGGDSTGPDGDDPPTVEPDPPSDDPPSDDPPANPDVASEEIGPAGGSITSTDGALTLEFPAGALSSAVTITIERLDPEDPGPELDEVREELGLRHAWELGPDGLSFDEPVEVAIVAERSLFRGDTLHAEDGGLYTSSGGESAVALDSVEVVVDVEGGTVTTRGRIEHFTKLAQSGTLYDAAVWVPDEVTVGTSFRVYSAVVVDLDIYVVHDVTYFDESTPPLRVTAASRQRVFAVSDDFLRYDVNLPYTCEKSAVAAPYRADVVVVDFPGLGSRQRETRFPFPYPINCVAPPEDGLAPAEVTGDYEVFYEHDPEASTCFENIDPYSVGAAFRVVEEDGEFFLEALFPDAPAPVLGPLELETGGFTGSTGPVEVFPGLEADEKWEGIFDTEGFDPSSGRGSHPGGIAGALESAAQGSVTFTGRSTVALRDVASGDECDRIFDVSAEKE